jgi:hypothetical protein
MKLLGIISVDLNIIYQLLKRFSSFVRYYRKKMGIQSDSTTTIHVLQESLRFSEEGIVQYSYTAWVSHEISQNDSSVFKWNI